MEEDKESKPFFFTAKTLPEEREERYMINVSLNPEERAWLTRQQDMLDLPGDSPALKLLAKVGANALRNTFSEDIVKFLVSKTRVRGEGRTSRNKIYKRKSFTKIG